MSKLDDFNPKDMDLSVQQLIQYFHEKKKMQEINANIPEIMKKISKMVNGMDFVLIVSGMAVHSVASTLTQDDLIEELTKVLEQSKDQKDNFENQRVSKD